MSAYIQRKYLDVISNRLDRFSWKSDKLANCRCPICGDSEKNSKKARGFFILRNDSTGDFYYYLCHNCGYTRNFSMFLKEHHADYYSLYRSEVYLEKNGSKPKPKAEVETLQIKRPEFNTSLIWNNATRIEDLSLDNEHRRYLLSRGVTEEYWNRLFFTEDYKQMVSDYSPAEGKKLQGFDPRIVLPLYTKEKKLFGFVGRTINPSRERYLTIKLDQEHTKVYGLDSMASSGPTFVLEGPIDALFIQNSIACCGTYLSPLYIKENISNPVVVLDNQPRNIDVVNTMLKYVKADIPVVVWKNISTSLKDINDMVLSGIKPQHLVDFMKKNTYTGMQAKLEIEFWKKASRS